MAKKVKNQKLSRPVRLTKIAKPVNNFTKHAQKITQRKHRNRENRKDVVLRMVKEAKRNKTADLRMTQGKKSKFDLDAEDPSNFKLTHRGVDVGQIDDFEQAQLASDQEMNEEYVQNLHFSGFEEAGPVSGQTRRKSKKQVYEQIMAKSKLYKEARQNQLEQNFEIANQLDEEFPQFVQNLKFIDRKQKPQKQERNYQKMLNQLREEPKAICEKVLKADPKKDQSKKRLKKMEFIRQLEGEDEQQDIRGWIKGVNKASSDEDNDNEEGDEEGDSDELDDVDLSSAEESGQEEGDDGEEEGDDGEEEGDDSQEQAGSDQSGDEQEMSHQE